MIIDRISIIAYVVSMAAVAFVLYDGKVQARCETTYSHDVCFQALNR